MNRTEAAAFANGMKELTSLERLQSLLNETDIVSIGSDTQMMALDDRDPVFGRHIGAAVAGLQSSVTNRIVDLKAQLGIVDDPEPQAETPATEAETTVEVAPPSPEPTAEPAADPVEAAPVEAPIATEPVAEPAVTNEAVAA